MLMELGAYARSLRTPTEMKIAGLQHWVRDAKRDLEAAQNDTERQKARRRLERFERPLRDLQSVKRIVEALRD